MSDDLQNQDPEYVKPDPALNPRNQVLAEIARGSAARHATEDGETFPSIDDDGNITPAPPADAPVEGAAPPAAAEASVEASTPAPAAPEVPPATEEEELVVEGQTIRVPKDKILEAGRRTFQKEVAADHRLKLASELLQEAEARVKAVPTAPQAPAAPAGPDPEFDELARAMQFGTPEQAAEALKQLAARATIDPTQVARLADERARAAVRDEVQFNEAMSFVQSEYGDLLSNSYVRRMFFGEENRRRAPKDRGGEGDTRPYKDLYKAIGDDLRKNLNMPKPGTPAPGGATTPSAGSAADRQERKAAIPPVPRTAAARMNESSGAPKPRTTAEIIAGMAASRGKNRLTEPRKGT